MTPDSPLQPQDSSAKKNDTSEPKSSVWPKVFSVLIVLVFLKACSYQTRGGENFGNTTQIVLLVVDKIIPWPSRDSYYEDEIQSEESLSDSNQQTITETQSQPDSNGSAEDIDEGDVVSQSYDGEYEYKTEALSDAAIRDILDIDSVLYHIPEGHTVYVIKDDAFDAMDKVSYAIVYCDGIQGYIKRSHLLSNQPR